VTDLAVDVFGEGETVVLVHGSGVRNWTWSDQLELADRYRLVLPWRRGYGDSPPADPDFDVDAKDLADLLDRPAHLVGFSYGGIGVMLAAARRPELVRSIVAIEPPAFGVAPDHPEVRALVPKLLDAYARPTAEEFGVAFADALGFEPRPPSPELLDALESFRRERTPDQAVIPYERLQGMPILIVTGGWHPAFEEVARVLVERLHADEAVFSGAGHPVQHAPGFNDRLVSFWESAARRPEDRP
jgi:pimeloyl-ACP methyl ester carboxylesterase